MREGGIGIGDPIHYLIEIGDSSTDLDCGLGIHCSDRPPAIPGF
jgi:hypothetical protein